MTYVPLGTILASGAPSDSKLAREVDKDANHPLSYEKHIAYGVEYPVPKHKWTQGVSYLLTHAIRPSQIAQVLSERTISTSDTNDTNSLPLWAIECVVNFHRFAFAGFYNNRPVWRCYGLQGWHFDYFVHNGEPVLLL